MPSAPAASASVFASVAFLKIHAFGRRPVVEQARLRAQLEAVVAEVLAEQPKAVATFRAGDEKALHFLMGQVMRKTKGQADAKRVRELLAARLGSGS